MYDIKENAVEQTIKQKVEDYSTRLEQKTMPKPCHCQICGHAGFLKWHGSYMRSLITLTQTYTLRIKRLFCPFCGHTFGLLPDFVMKFYRYAKQVIHFAIRMLRSHTFEAVAGKFILERKKRCLAILTLYFWRRKFAG